MYIAGGDSVILVAADVRLIVIIGRVVAIAVSLVVCPLSAK